MKVQKILSLQISLENKDVVDRGENREEDLARFAL
jgi:hypothetical protein